MTDIVDNLRNIADASRRSDGSDIPLGKQLRDAIGEIVRLRSELSKAQTLIEETAIPHEVLKAKIRREAFDEAHSLIERTWPEADDLLDAIRALAQQEGEQK